MKITKNKFITSTFILILSGMATKVLGLIIKILFTRIVGNTTISLYTLVMPTYSLFLSIADFAMPTTIAKLYAENKYHRLLENALIIIFILNFLLVTLLIIFAPFIANNLLNNSLAYPLIISCAFTLPLASIACILKGYFYGKKKMVPHVISNVIEQLIRIILIITILPKLIKISYVYAACGLILTSVVTEFASIITFLLLMNKNDKINLKNIKIRRDTTTAILGMSIPIVGSRIISNIAYFLEPIVLTKTLLKNGFSNNYIMLEYGAYNAYAISTLCIPSFFISAISMALLPELSGTNSRKTIKKRIIEAFVFAGIIGIFSSSICFFFGKNLLNILYKTTLGANYMKILSLFFPLFYLEPIFNTIFQSFNKTKIIFYISIISSFTKTILIYIFGRLKFGIYALVYSEIISIFIVILLDIICIITCKKYICNVKFK